MTLIVCHLRIIFFSILLREILWQCCWFCQSHHRSLSSLTDYIFLTFIYYFANRKPLLCRMYSHTWKLPRTNPGFFLQWSHESLRITILPYKTDSMAAAMDRYLARLTQWEWSYLTGVGVGPFTCLTGEGDCWRPPVTLETKDGGDLEVGFGGTRGGVLWAKCWVIIPPSTCISIMVVAWKLASIFCGEKSHDKLFNWWRYLQTVQVLMNTWIRTCVLWLQERICILNLLNNVFNHRNTTRMIPLLATFCFQYN